MRNLILTVYHFGAIAAVPAFHHFFHKGAEHGIHTVVHKLHRFKVLNVKLLPDAVMIAILIGLDAIWELFGKE